MNPTTSVLTVLGSLISASVSDAFVVPMMAPRGAPSAFAAENKVGGTPTMVATPDRVSTAASSSAFEPTKGPNAPLRVNNNGQAWVPQRQRPRRNRKSEAVRSMVRENVVRPANFIYPLFIHEEDFEVEIKPMPGCLRHSLPHMLKEVEEAWQFGVRTFVVFPKVPDNLKTNYADECYNPSGIVPRAVSMIKERFPDSIVCTD
ncbi:unnamed protein product, partial [Ectocarpus sp. 13 AM-2016]